MTGLTKVVDGVVLPLTEADIAQIEIDDAAAPAMQWDQIRRERNSRLTACDWTQIPDAPVDAQAWAAYRQALRDITKQSDPFNIIWPSWSEPQA